MTKFDSETKSTYYRIEWDAEDALKQLKRKALVLEVARDSITQRRILETRLSKGVVLTEKDCENFDAISPKELRDIISGEESDEIRSQRIDHAKMLIKHNSCLFEPR